MTQLSCAICAERYPFHWPCEQAHPDVCHWCAAKNLTGGFESWEHTPPRETSTLTAREAAAVAAYTAMLVRTVGVQQRMQLLREEDTL